MTVFTKHFKVKKYYLPENQVFSIGNSASRTQDSPARWGLATVLRFVNTEALTMFDWLLSSMNTDATADDSEDYSVSSVLIYSVDLDAAVLPDAIATSGV